MSVIYLLAELFSAKLNTLYVLYKYSFLSVYMVAEIRPVLPAQQNRNAHSQPAQGLAGCVYDMHLFFFVLFHDYCTNSRIAMRAASLSRIPSLMTRVYPPFLSLYRGAIRSEERRVGKECRSRWS